MIKIDYEKCCWQDGKCSGCSCDSGCGDACVGCAEACPVQAIVRKSLVLVDPEKCINCGACVVACKHGAISL